MSADAEQQAADQLAQQRIEEANKAAEAAETARKAAAQQDGGQ
ncbi:hypothetical protein [Streptomyces sp. NPDC056132]